MPTGLCLSRCTLAPCVEQTARSPLPLGLSRANGSPSYLRELKNGTARYGHLQRRIPEASQKMLTAQLRQLEHDGLVERTVHGGALLRTEYALTPYGATLRPALVELARWGQRHKRLTL